MPDITMVSPVFTAENTTTPSFFVASRAHHADVGGMSPGSMPLSHELYQEGIIIPPIKLVAAGVRNEAVWQLLLHNVRTPTERAGDLNAQLAAHRVGARRLGEIVTRYGVKKVFVHATSLIDYAKKLACQAISAIPDGVYTFHDHLDDDGHGTTNIPIAVTITVHGTTATVDFTGTAPAVRGNLNAVPAIVHSAVAYCVRCVALATLAGIDIPMNAGLFAPLDVRIPAGSLLAPHHPHAVAAGNVETSQRIVDVLFGALAQALPQYIPAASQGTMNNLAFGGTHHGKPFAYYETIGGGSGANALTAGAHGRHSHMTNTRNTPIEALEYAYPLRIHTYAIRKNSGGQGRNPGGNGVVRTLEFLCPTTVTLTTERRRLAPYGLQGGKTGQSGQNLLQRNGAATAEPLPGKVTLHVERGDTLTVETPGGGGWGSPPKQDET